MASAYIETGKADLEAVFHMTFRENPFEGGYAVACGLDLAIDYIERWRFDDDDRRYLATLEGNDGTRLFEDDFLAYLGELRFSGDVDAIPEGTLVFPGEPLLRVRGPICECQLLETPLLNIVNFQTLIATKASRVCSAAKTDAVLEFGLRRAQGVDGGIGASRAAYVGGCAATSNVLAGKLFDIPVKGTHAHSWVMAFDTELEAFDAYARAMPNNCVFLVDTYDSVQGVKNAIAVAERLREQGHDFIGIRLDSGDLAWLSRRARAMLDEAGFEDAVVMGSNELDERVIESLKDQGATIAVWGVGTKLATADGQPSLGGVYKLSAIRAPAGEWEYRVKVSEQAAKVTTPGMLQVRRFFSDEGPQGDMVYSETASPPGECTMIDPGDSTRRKSFCPTDSYSDLLVPVFRGGECVYERQDLVDLRDRTLAQVDQFGPGVTRFLNPHQYPVGLEAGLFEEKTRLIMAARGYL
jgi:nicotinate phosphoribosyltransferase